MTVPRWRQVLIALGKAGCYLALFLGWQVLVSGIYSAVIAFELSDAMGIVTEEAYYDAVTARTMEISLVSGLLTLGSVCLLFRLRRRKLRQELWLRPVSARVLAWSAAMAFCLYWLVTLVMGLLPASWLDDYADASAGLTEAGLLPFLATAIVAPVVEEVIFRGLIYTRLQRALSSGAAMIVSAAIFGACHGDFIWFCYAFFLGLVFALLVRSTRSILPALLMHVVFNATNEVLTFFPDWEPGLWFYALIFLLATAGAFLCAVRLRDALAAAPVPSVVAERRTGEDTTPSIAPLDPSGTAVQPPHPSCAGWDPDSGAEHRFPAEKL